MSRAPYKYLDYYTFEDADLFFGREFEVQRMVGEILTSRLLVLFSPSGSGKTSLINAGVRPALEQLGHATAYVRFDKPPIPAVLDAVAKRLNAPLGENTEDLHAWFSHYYAHNEHKPTVVIFLDQFEEFFIIYRDQPEVREKFIAQLARLKYDAALPVNIVLSLREDYFVNLHEFRAAVPSIFQNNANIRLRPFTESEARRAILEPAKAVGLSYEDGFADTLIADLQAQTPDKEGVAPIILQMVCHTLWQKRGPNNGAITCKLYDQCGRAQTIIANRLSQSLDRIPQREHGLMVKLFRALKTPDNLKRYRSLPDLQEALPNVASTRLQKLLDQLTREEVLRHETRKSVSWYEFRHDYLVPQIAQWITQREERQQQKRMRYAIMPGAVLASIIFIWAFIRFNTFEAHFEPHVEGLKRELVITRGFNPFDYKIATGFFEEDVRTDVRTKNALEVRAFVAMWRVRDWDKVIPLLELIPGGEYLHHTGRLEAAKDTLFAALKNTDREARFRAALALASLGKSDARVIKALVAALHGREAFDDPYFRQLRVYLFERDRAASVWRSLGKSDKGVIAALKNKDWNVESSAASALVSLGKSDATVIAALEAALKDQNLKVSSRVASVLVSLGKSDATVIAALVAALKDQNWDVRYGAASALVSLGKSDVTVIAALVAALKDENSSVRSLAASALVSLGKSDATVIAALEAALKDQNLKVSSRVASVLVSLGKSDAMVIAALVAALKDQNWDVRYGAASALVSLGKSDVTVIAALVAALKDENSSVRSLAASALVSLRKSDATVIAALVAALKDENSSVRSLAASALVSLGKSDATVIAALVAALKDQGSGVRSDVASALGSLGRSDATVIAALVAALKDQNEYVRSSAASAFGSLGKSDEGVIAALVAALKDQNEYVRSNAASSLVSLGKSDEVVIAALVTALKGQDSDVRSRAASSLVSLGKSDEGVIAALVAALKDQDRNVRSRAASALVSLGKSNEGVIAALVTALKGQDSDVRSRAASSLVSLGKSDEGVIAALVAALKDQDINVRSRAASALGSLYKTSSATSLLKLFEHHQSGYRTAAVEAIAAQDTISAALEQAVKQKRDTAPEPWTRLAAWDAYERIQQRRPHDRADSLARTQADSVFARADSLFKAQDYSAAEEVYSRAYDRLFIRWGSDEGLNRVSHSDSLKMATFQFAQARCQSLQKRLLPALESLETAFKYDPTLKEKLANELERHTDWAHIRQNWYLREVLLGQAPREEGVQ